MLPGPMAEQPRMSPTWWSLQMASLKKDPLMLVAADESMENAHLSSLVEHILALQLGSTDQYAHLIASVKAALELGPICFGHYLNVSFVEDAALMEHHLHCYWA